MAKHEAAELLSIDDREVRITHPDKPYFSRGVALSKLEISSSCPCLRRCSWGAASNALDVQFIPTAIRKWCQTGIRERLWNSRAGEWLARRLGAPERSKLAGASAFRATEAALGVAASELFSALPKEYREQLAELPAIVAALEARAAEARAEMEGLAALAPNESGGAEVLAARKKRRRTTSPRASPRSEAYVSIFSACTPGPGILRRLPR